MSTFKTVAKNTLFQLVGKVVTVLLAIGITKILATNLGPQGYGQYTFITAFVLLFGVIADWGTTIISVKEASQNENRRHVVFGTSTLFRLILAGITVLFVNLVAYLNNDWSSLSLPIFIGSLVLLALSLKTSFGIIFQTMLRYEFASMIEIISSLSFFLLILIAFYFHWGISGVIGAWVIATIIASLAGLFFSLRLTAIEWKLDGQVVKSIFWQALPAGALFIVFTIYNRIDTLILQYYQGSEAVGIYGLAYKVHDNLVLGAAFLMNALFPYFAQAAKNKEFSTLKRQYQKAFDIMLVGSTLLCLSFFILSPIIVNFLGGDKFLPAVTALQILVFATLFAYFNHLTGYTLLALGKQKSSLIIAAVALVFNIAANFIFVPLYSYKASSFITVATEGLVLVLSSIVVAKTIQATPNLFSFPKTILEFVKTKKIEF